MQNDLIYITNLPSFYKINLLNRISKKRKILVIFTHETSDQRNSDFFIGAREFEFISISNMTLIRKINFIYNLLKKRKYNQLIVGGWDQFIFWIAIFLSSKKKNSVAVESSIIESETNGLKGWIKKIFISRISKAYVPGKSNADLCKALNFKGQYIITKGVGIFNIQPQPIYKVKTSVKNYIYVGRLSTEKNLRLLIETFNQLSNLNLNIVGFGPEESYLKSIAESNIIFHGEIPNTELHKTYAINDVFILPSTSETWGLVIEEAFNNGLPVIVSDKVGCASEIINKSNGLIFQITDPEGLKDAILKMQNIKEYNKLRESISKMDFNAIAQQQVNCYL